MDCWLPAASLRLTDEDLNEIADAIRHTGAGTGPDRPRAPVEEGAGHS